MADSGLVLPPTGRPAISTLVRTDLDEQIYQGKFYARSIMVWMIMAANGTKSSYFGIGMPRVEEGVDPDRARQLWMSGHPTERLRMLKSANSDTFQPGWYVRPPENQMTRHRSFYDNTATSADWAGNTIPQTIKRGICKWTYGSQEIVVSKDEQGFITSGDAVPGLTLTVETSRSVQSQMIAAVDSDLHTAAGPTSVNDDYWDYPYSVREGCKTDNIYMGLDRSDDANAAMRGNYTTSVGAITFRGIQQYDNFNTAGPQLNKFGASIRYYLCNGDLYSKAIVEAEKRGARPTTVGQIPQFMGYGAMEAGAVQIDDGCYVICDPGMASGEVFGFNPKTWSIGIKQNFQAKGFNDMSTIRGQPRILWSEMEVKYLGPICNAPWANTYRTGCT